MATLTDVALALEALGPGSGRFPRLLEILQSAAGAPIGETRGLLSDLARKVREEKGEDGAAALDRAVFAGILVRGLDGTGLFPNLAGARELWADRAAALVERARASGAFPSLQEDAGLVEALVLLGKYIPVGVYHAVISAVPRSVLWSAAPRDALRLAVYITLEMRGFGPVIEIHLPKVRTGHFLEADYVAAHRRVAGLLRQNRWLRGLYGASWYYDPAVSRISPHLAFLNTFASAHGSLLARLGSDPGVVQDATWKSQRRRTACEAGTYVPIRYARLWSRRRILAWADSTGGDAR